MMKDGAWLRSVGVSWGAAGDKRIVKKNRTEQD